MSLANLIANQVKERITEELTQSAQALLKSLKSSDHITIFLTDEDLTKMVYKALKLPMPKHTEPIDEFKRCQHVFARNAARRCEKAISAKYEKVKRCATHGHKLLKKRSKSASPKKAIRHCSHIKKTRPKDDSEPQLAVCGKGAKYPSPDPTDNKNVYMCSTHYKQAIRRLKRAKQAAEKQRMMAEASERAANEEEWDTIAAENQAKAAWRAELKDDVVHSDDEDDDLTDDEN